MPKKLGIQHKVGDIIRFCDPVKSDRDHIQKFVSLTPGWADDSIKPILATEGWMSMGGVDRMGDIVDPGGWELDNFLKYPVLMFHHDWTKMLLGIWTSVEIRNEGLYGRNVIYDTALGRDVSTLIQAAVYRAYSVGFNPIEFSFMEESGIHFTRQELIECSPVPSPAHLGATIEVVESLKTAEILQRAKEHNLTLKYFTAPTKSYRKGKTMDLTPEIVDQKIADATKAQATVTASELGDKFKAVAKIQKEIEDIGKRSNLSKGEVEQIVENVTADYTKAFNTMQDEIKQLKNRKNVSISPQLMPGTLKGMMNLTPAVVRGSLPAPQAEQVLILHKMNDELMFVDQMLATSSEANGGLKGFGDYHDQPKEKRMQQLKAFKARNEFAKAMDTETAGEGLEWVHTTVSGSLIEDIRLNQVIAPNFEEIRMTGATMIIDTDDSETDAKLIGQKKTLVSSFDSNEETVSSGNMTLAVVKCRGRYQISAEMTEDAAFAVMPLYMRRITESIARAEDNAIMNGNASGVDANLDSGITLVATNFNRAFNGLRYAQYQTINSGTQGDVIGVSGAVHNAVMHGKTRGQMGKYGSRTDQLRMFSSVKGYLLRLLNADEMPQFHTLEKYGPQAVVLTGESGRIYNVPNLQTEFISDDLNASGIADGSSAGRTAFVYVNVSMFIRGIWRNVEVVTEKDNINDVFNMVAFKRMDFKPTFTPSATVPSVNVMYNLATD